MGSELRNLLVGLGASCAVVSCALVFIFIGFDASLILAQVIAVPLAVAFILDSRIREKQKRIRGETTWWTGIVVADRKIRVRVDWNSCMGASSCVELAPKVFRLDWSKKKSMFDPAPLELLNERPSSVDPDIVFRAAQSCPYHAIILEDDETGERIFP